MGHKVSFEFKWRYIKAVLTKDIEWFDGQDVNSIAPEIFMNIDTVESATGIQLGYLFLSVAA